MQGRLIIILLVSFTLLFSLTASAQEKVQEEETKCATLLLTKCDACHYLTRVCYRVGKKSRRSWKRSLNAMVRHGTQLTEAQLDTLLACLSEPAPEAEKTCRDYLGY
jgi:hypothetical protein